VISLAEVLAAQTRGRPLATAIEEEPMSEFDTESQDGDAVEQDDDEQDAGWEETNDEPAEGEGGQEPV
jgi:hypothetical protein